MGRPPRPARIAVDPGKLAIPESGAAREPQLGKVMKDILVGFPMPGPVSAEGEGTRHAAPPVVAVGGTSGTNT